MVATLLIILKKLSGLLLQLKGSLGLLVGMIPTAYIAHLLKAIPQIIGGVAGALAWWIFYGLKELVWLFIRFFFWLAHKIAGATWAIISIAIFGAIGLTASIGRVNEVPEEVWLMAVLWLLITPIWGYAAYLIKYKVPI